IQASGAVNGDEVVVGSRDSFLYGIDLATGKERWRVGHPNASWVVATAAIWRGAALVATSDAHTFEAVDRDGTMKWSAPIPAPSFSSAVIADDVAYAGCDDGSLFAFDAATGRRLWRFWIGAEIDSSPAFRDN